MVKIKYTGKGMLSRDITFDAVKNGGLYTVTVEDSEYFIKTFPRQFELIEKVVEKKATPAKPRAKRTQKKTTDTTEG